MKIHVYDIDWDTSDWGEEEELASGVCVPDLPSEVDLEIDDGDWRGCDPDDIVANMLSDKYDFLINGFYFEIINDEDSELEE